MIHGVHLQVLLASAGVGALVVLSTVLVVVRYTQRRAKGRSAASGSNPIGKDSKDSSPYTLARL